MDIRFPYRDVPALLVPDENLLGVFRLPEISSSAPPGEMIAKALANPIESPPLRDILDSSNEVLIVSDDNTRNTPVKEIMPQVIRELEEAGVKDENVGIIMALGTHRPMTVKELEEKLGKAVVSRFRVINHDCRNNLFFYGTTSLGVEVWVNREVRRADCIIGLGRIMPIMVAGFTGGGKIIVPGICGDKTNDQMHWESLNVPEKELLGKLDNPVRAIINEVASKVGLKFIVNVVMNSASEVVQVVAGHPVQAHGKGCLAAKEAHTVIIPREADIVIADGYPFDLEFWQVNKALDAAGLTVRKGGVVILVSPCYEGVSRSHPEIVDHGYQEVTKIKRLVEDKIISPTVGVHMIQVSRVAVEKARCVLVSEGLSEKTKLKLGLLHAATPQEALTQAFNIAGRKAKIAVLRNAAEMIPVVKQGG